MKNLKKYIANKVVSLAIIITTINVNSTCPFVSYQPEVSDDIKKLRKF